jgi:polyisoprenoid-binding protein YceI
MAWSTRWRLLVLRRFVLGLVLVRCVAAAPALPAQAIGIALDPATTAIHWTLVTNTHTVHGTFKLKSGAVRLDLATEGATGLIVVDAASGESGSSARDARMQKEILESAKYPTIAFKPTRIEKFDVIGTQSIAVAGVMTLHGQDHPMVMTVDLKPNGKALEVTTHFAVPFVEWGIKDPSTFVFRTEKKVEIEIQGTATVTPETGPAGRAP